MCFITVSCSFKVNYCPVLSCFSTMKQVQQEQRLTVVSLERAPLALLLFEGQSRRPHRSRSCSDVELSTGGINTVDEMMAPVMVAEIGRHYNVKRARCSSSTKHLQNNICLLQTLVTIPPYFVFLIFFELKRSLMFYYFLFV